jgi:formylglycine-generating enzyme required for sulfatase activity
MVSLPASNIKIDDSSKRIWQNNDAVEINKKTWYEAKDYCEELVLDNYKDWRLPSIQELQVLVDTKKSIPAIREGFDFTISDYYWSSTIKYNDEYNAWLIHFEYGFVDYSSTSGKNFVRCVHNTL